MTSWLRDNALVLIGPAVTLFGFFVSASVVVYQLARQSRNSLRLQRDNEREKLKLRIYENLIVRVKELSHANVVASIYCLSILGNIKTYQFQLTHGFSPAPIKDRAMEFARLNSEASDALIRMIEEFEAWSIAFPGLEVFQTALNAAHYDAREAFQPLFSEFLNVLPSDPPADAPTHVPRPIPGQILDAARLTSLEALIETYRRAMEDIGAYVSDLRVEAQNNLLSGLFDHRVASRKPLDPDLKVISTSPKAAQELIKYFEEDTAWGKMKARTETEVKQTLNIK